MVEQRSPKPRAEGSSPSAPATPKALKQRGFKAFCFIILRTAHGIKIHLLMFKLSVNFASVANDSQYFRLLHHQHSINQHRVFLSYFPFSLFIAVQILTANAKALAVFWYGFQLHLKPFVISLSLDVSFCCIAAQMRILQKE